MTSEKCANCGYREVYHPIHISGKKVQETGEIFLDWLCEKFIPQKEGCGKLFSTKLKGFIPGTIYFCGNKRNGKVMLCDKCKKFIPQNQDPIIQGMVKASIPEGKYIIDEEGTTMEIIKPQNHSLHATSRKVEKKHEDKEPDNEDTGASKHGDSDSGSDNKETLVENGKN